MRGIGVKRRPASVSGRGSVSDQRQAACVGGSRERAWPTTRRALTPHAFRLPRTPHEHAHAPRSRGSRLAGHSDGPEFPDRLCLGSKTRLAPMGAWGRGTGRIALRHARPGRIQRREFLQSWASEDDFRETTRSNPLAKALQPCLACWHLTLASTTDCDRSDNALSTRTGQHPPDCRLDSGARTVCIREIVSGA